MPYWVRQPSGPDIRTHRPIRRSRHATAKADLRGRIPDTVHQRATRQRRGSGRARALGRGSVVRVGEQLHGHAGRTADPLRNARQDPEPRYAHCRQGTDQVSQPAARRTLQVADLGPRLRTRRSQALHAGHRHRSVLLRSAESLAAWLEREHQSLVTTVFPPKHRSIGPQSGPTEPSGKRTQRAAS